MTEGMPGTVCPSCGLNDRISKVSAIYASETSTMSRVQSDLARKLQPPRKPTSKVGCMGWLAVFMVWCLFFYLTIRTLLHLLNIDFNKGPTTEMIVFVIVVYLGTLIAAIIVVSWRAKRKAEGKMPAWREAMERWNSLYYCARDGIVFDPETGAVAPISSETE